VADAILHAAGQAWPPFVLVSGLLLIGAVVEADGLFRAVGTRIELLGGGPVTLLAVLLGVEAIVTALLNLDTAVVFLTPIILHAARQRRCDERLGYLTSVSILNIGRYIAMTMTPTISPTRIIISGSTIDVSD
jgi:arsenical pump membrane protein